MTRTLTAALAALALAACGSTSNAKPAATSTPAAATPAASPAPNVTHAEFVKALNRACSADPSKRARQQFEKAMNRSDLKSASEFFKPMLAAQTARTAQAAAMTAPDVDKEAFERYVLAQKRVQGIGERIGRALEAEDLDKVADLTRLLTEESDRRLTAAIDIGADKCGA